MTLYLFNVLRLLLHCNEMLALPNAYALHWNVKSFYGTLSNVLDMLHDMRLRWKMKPYTLFVVLHTLLLHYWIMNLCVVISMSLCLFMCCFCPLHCDEMLTIPDVYPLHWTVKACYGTLFILLATTPPLHHGTMMCQKVCERCVWERLFVPSCP